MGWGTSACAHGRIVARFSGMAAAVMSVALVEAEGSPWLLCGCENGAVYVYPTEDGSRTRPHRTFRSDIFHLSTVDLLEPLDSRLVGKAWTGRGEGRGEDKKEDKKEDNTEDKKDAG